jgi:hypothetical protein
MTVISHAPSFLRQLGLCGRGWASAVLDPTSLSMIRLPIGAAALSLPRLERMTTPSFSLGIIPM